MQILAKKRFEFRLGEAKFTTAGNNIIENAPDWIAKTPFFAAIVKDGDILEIKTDTIVVGGTAPGKPADKPAAPADKPVTSDKTQGNKK